MKIKYIVYAILIIGLSGFIVYRINSNKSKNETPKDKNGGGQPILVNGIVVKPEDFDNLLSLSGSIEANEQVEIRSEVSGIVQSINFKEGSTVQKGQLLFKVNDIELRAQRSQAITRRNLASENERRARLLLQKEAISQEEYDVSRADLRLAQSQSELINAQIAKTSVRAPFSGKIGLRSISPGTYITPTTLIANLVNTNNLKITFSIPEKYANQIKLNTVINFTVAGSTKKYTAKIYAIEPNVDVNTRTLQVRALAENKDGALLPGTYANVALPLAVFENAIVVPTEAVVPVQDGKKVFIAANGKAKEVKVETATRTDASVIVLSGLKAGDTLVTTGVMSLKDEAKIKVITK
ncbi:MAG TPA: efflux RND transporter periplasmic adaptor subunit [Flavobacterium sp.]|jgi:membrane fusion protein (multidrug efflux system)